MSQNQTLIDNTARIFRIGRKVLGKTQVEIAESLSVSQGTISKYEAGILQPSALDWFNFCTYTNIDSYRSLKDGYIDNCSRIQDVFYQKMGFTLPKRYKQRQVLKVREALPIIMHAKEELGQEGWLEFLKTVKMDDDYFHVYDATLSLNFVQDLLSSEALKSKPRKFLEKAARLSSDLSSHGNLKSSYLLENDSQGLVRSYMNKTGMYEDVFTYQQIQQNGSLRLELQPKISGENLADQKFLDLYMEYKLESLKHLVTENCRGVGMVNLINDTNRKGLEIGLVA